MNMFQRANATYEAKNRFSQPSIPLTQHLLSSSSGPSVRPHDNAFAKDQPFKQVGSRPSFSKFSQPSRPVVSAQASTPSRSAGDPFRTQDFVGLQHLDPLYGQQDSFEEGPEIYDPTVSEDLGSIQNGMFPDVEYFEDDFSDDATLDLDYERPSALPAPKPNATPADHAGDNASTISWSQSSPSHLQPAKAVSHLTPLQKGAKRTRPEGDVFPGQPTVKKRVMPDVYGPFQEGAAEVDSAPTQPSTTLSASHHSKAQGPQTWDLPADALKAQQKRLKEKSKTSVGAGAETAVEQTPPAIKSYSVKQSAMTLSKEQEYVKNIVCDDGNSVFFTGPAGTGKSVLMRAIIQDLKKKYARDPERLAVTASTGLAACNIGGMTLHSFAGIGLGKDDTQTLIRKIRRNAKAKNRWIRTKVLIIDEISMVDGELFDKLSQIARVIRNNGRPWGGMQLVITGDFFQLPPVPDSNMRDCNMREIKFAFEAATWNTSIDHTIGLAEVFRQKDPVFANMLNEMRLGRISDQTVATFKELSRPLTFEDGLEVTELFPTRHEVEDSNQRRLTALPGSVHRYNARDSGNPAVRDKLLANMMAPKVLELKTGAQVMLIKNLDETLVNGSLGTVIGFSTERAFEVSGGNIEPEVAAQGYVDPKTQKRLAAFSRQLSERSDVGMREYPLVQFHAVDGTARIMLCCSEPWKVETPTGEVQAARDQLPLILAWALSIHKAQGQTLARVKVDLGKVFEKGQAYVALSRAVTQAGLQVLRFDKQKVMAHPRVLSFYQKLYSAETAVKKKPEAPMTTVRHKGMGKPASMTGALVVEEESEAMAANAF